MRIVSVGEILWDVIGKNEYLGGAPLNFAAHAQKLGHEVYPLSAVGADARGRKALDLLKARAMSTEFVQVLEDKPTGTAEVELDMEGKPSFRIVRPVAYDFVDLTDQELKRIAEIQPDWIYLGTLYHMSAQALASTKKLLKAVPKAKRFYDVNLRAGHWSLATIEQLSSLATVTKLSDSEAESLDASVDASEGPGHSIENFCRRWCDRFGCETMCVTFGERGCAILKDGKYSTGAGLPRDCGRHSRCGRCLLRRLRSRPQPGMGFGTHRAMRERGRCAGGQPLRRDSRLEHRRSPRHHGGASSLGKLFRRHCDLRRR